MASLNIGLLYAEQLDPWTREELQQLVASLQAQIGNASNTGNTSGSSVGVTQFVQVTYASGATTATAPIPIPVDLTSVQFSILGEEIASGTAGGITMMNASRIDPTVTTGSLLALRRALGIDTASNNVTGTVTVQVVSQRGSSI